jgi:hypothetical protein
MYEIRNWFNFRRSADVSLSGPATNNPGTLPEISVLNGGRDARS